jgi:hypothetical protein
MFTPVRWNALTMFALVVLLGCQSWASAADPVVTATLQKSHDDAAYTLHINSTVTGTGFAKDKPATVVIKVYSMKDDGTTERKLYSSQTHPQLTTNNAGTVTVNANTVNIAKAVFDGDEGLNTGTSTPSWEGDTKPKFYARKFKVHVTVTVDGVSKTGEVITTGAAE